MRTSSARCSQACSTTRTLPSARTNHGSEVTSPGTDGPDRPCRPSGARPRVPGEPDQRHRPTDAARPLAGGARWGDAGGRVLLQWSRSWWSARRRRPRRPRRRSLLPGRAFRFIRHIRQRNVTVDRALRVRREPVRPGPVRRGPSTSAGHSSRRSRAATWPPPRRWRTTRCETPPRRPRSGSSGARSWGSSASTGPSEQSSPRTEPPYTNVTVSTSFATATVPLIVTVGRDGRVAGLHLGQARASRRIARARRRRLPASPAAYVDPGAFTEADITVGEAPWALPGTLSMPVGPGPFPAVVLVAGSGPQDRDETIGPNAPLRDIAGGLASAGSPSSATTSARRRMAPRWPGRRRRHRPRGDGRRRRHGRRPPSPRRRASTRPGCSWWGTAWAATWPRGSPHRHRATSPVSASSRGILIRVAAPRMTQF